MNVNSLNHENIVTHTPSENCLEGKVILVTGAGDGIGKVASLTYARYGATVLLLGKTLSKLESVYDEIESFNGKQPAMLPMNLAIASYEEMQELARKIEKEFGKLDGVLHNAGILGTLSTLEEIDIATFQQVMHVNFTATFMLTQALFDVLKISDNPSILFTTSGVTNPLRANWGAYALSKQAVEGMSDLFTQETQDNPETAHLRFNSINPGSVRTSMRAKAYPDEDPMILKVADDIMPAYVSLMSDDSLAIKGEVINLSSIKR